MKSLQARVKALLDETGLPVSYGWPALWKQPKKKYELVQMISKLRNS